MKARIPSTMVTADLHHLFFTYLSYFNLRGNPQVWCTCKLLHISCGQVCRHDPLDTPAYATRFKPCRSVRAGIKSARSAQVIRSYGRSQTLLDPRIR